MSRPSQQTHRPQTNILLAPSNYRSGDGDDGLPGLWPAGAHPPVPDGSRRPRKPRTTATSATTASTPITVPPNS
ncbi:hypothetical protein Cci01nite_21390 [Catellatospora citrea]|uniref:Uncharacterized protein n=1 Tax=Catellatospora citrea TaxID=53366 RepID=A0A8J3NY23_9ACTN|nr:hypothetical protein Cci01nite_21390 [Catellatospora citrea]